MYKLKFRECMTYLMNYRGTFYVIGISRETRRKALREDTNWVGVQSEVLSNLRSTTYSKDPQVKQYSFWEYLSYDDYYCS